MKLLGRDELQARPGGVQRLSDHFTHGATALAAIEFATMMGLHGLGAPRTSFNSFAHSLVIDTAADANDHENHLQLT